MYHVRNYKIRRTDRWEMRDPRTNRGWIPVKRFTAEAWLRLGKAIEVEPRQY